MSQTILSLEQTPPLSVPAPFFAAAPLFAAAAGLLLALEPDLFQSRWLPGTLALTHLLTLGFFALVMLGAFQQLLPVLAGTVVPRAGLSAAIIFGTVAGGAAALAIGLAAENSRWIVTALTLLAGGLLLFLVLAATALYRSPSRHPTIRAMGAAVAALAVAVGLGFMLAAGHAGFGPLLRQFTEQHAAFGLVGWIALLVAGVAWQVVPMFQMTPEYPSWLVRMWVPAVGAALALFAFGAETRGPLAALPGGLLLAAFALATLDRQRRRRRRLPDVTVAFWQDGMFSLLGAVALWPGAALFGFDPSPLAVGVLFLAGFGMSVVSGMLYKIVPFLVWLHLNNLRFATGHRFEVPTMKQVIPEARARRQLLVNRLALCFLLVAAFVPAEPLVRTAGLAFTLSSVLLAANLWSGLALYRRLRRECAVAADAEER